MGKNTKVKHIINWNLITLISTLCIVLLGIILNWNQRQINILESELNRSEEVIKDLQSEIDPEWHFRYNNQKEFYESEITKRDSLIKINSIASSNVAKEIVIEGKKIVLSERQRDKLVEKLIRAKIDSIEIQSYKIENQFSKEIDSLKSSIIEKLSEQNENYRLINENNRLIIKNLEKRIELVNSKNSNYFVPLILVSLISLFSIFMAFLKKKKKWKKEN